MKRLRRAGTIAAIAAFLVLALWNGVWLLISGRDLASTVLVGLASVIGAASAYCVGRTVDERGQRVGFLWAGRALATAGAAIAVAFPATLYGEIVMLAQQGKAPTYDIEAAIWHEFRVLPLALLPALVSLRWGRIAGVTMLVLTAYGIANGIFHFGGVNYYPEAQPMDIGILLESQGPAVLTSIFLIFGSQGWRGDTSVPSLRWKRAVTVWTTSRQVAKPRS